MKRTIRILQVCGIMNRGGIETMLMNLFRKIDRDKIVFDFMVHSREEGSYDEEIKALGGNIYYVPQYNGANHLLYSKEWKRFFEEHPEHTIIHGHMRSTAGIYLKIAKKYNRATILHSHSTSIRGKGIAVLIKGFWQYMGRYSADYFFSCGQDAGEWLFGKKIVSGDRFYLVKNAIDVENFAYDGKKREELRDEKDLSDKYVVGHVGSFTPVKNHKFLLEMFMDVKKHKDNAVLYLVGQGPLEKEIEQRIVDFDLEDSVIMAGTTSRVQDAFLLMDVFVFPSIHEGLPMVLMEEQVTGLPCIANGEGITTEAKVTELIEFMALSEGARAWSEKVLAVNTKGRKTHSKELIYAGYDVNVTAQWLCEFYLGLIRVHI